MWLICTLSDARVQNQVFKAVAFKTSQTCEDKHCDRIRHWWGSHAQTSRMAIIISRTHAAPNKEVSNLESNHHRWWVSQNTQYACWHDTANSERVERQRIWWAMCYRITLEQALLKKSWECTGQFPPRLWGLRLEVKAHHLGSSQIKPFCIDCGSPQSLYKWSKAGPEHEWVWSQLAS